VPTESLLPVWLLAAVNFLGAWFLQLSVAHNPELYGLSALVGIITVYGTLFIAVPLVRWLILQVLNTKIEARNAKRQSYAHLFEHPSPELSKKLIEAKDQKIKLERLDEEKIIYTTEKDALEQEFEEKGFDATP
jgi:thiol:disulfide interchange protein